RVLVRSHPPLADGRHRAGDGDQPGPARDRDEVAAGGHGLVRLGRRGPGRYRDPGRRAAGRTGQCRTHGQPGADRRRHRRAEAGVAGLMAGRDTRDISPLWLAAGAGAALWIAGTLMAGGREAWDAPTYMLRLYPLSLVVSGLLAHRHPDQAAGIAFALFAGQMAVLFVLNPGGGMLPLGVIVFFVMSLPAVVVA